MTPGPASLQRSLGLHVVLPRAGVLLVWLALNHFFWLPVFLAWGLIAADGVLLAWQSRDLLRSTDGHIRSTGSMAPVWGSYLVLLFAGFATLTQWWGALLTAGQVETLPYAQQQEQARQQLYSLTLSDDGRTLIFTGEITHGLTRRIAATLDAAPEVRSLHLTGPGGLIYEARGVAKLIRTRGLDTKAADLCASACTVIFAAGQERLLAPKGQLGFHGYALMFEGGLPQLDLKKEQQKDLSFFLQQGISEGFVQRVFEVANSDLWIPEHAELRAAGVITAGAD
ncbi:hypothetical protein PXK30_08145 [Phaeobacter gallaeciensis]|uniref:COG3904 family protein n=1 Tax=Phaeobacter gallaeciensis TaxID=60890 RepID=UPI00237EFBED|nr:hypothetical protein [Phaeobacter gallaeciensis]MDE4303216.1 hypothetical protein [Phaeobacter gallaeciensis]MDE4307608.1 hypothetical protein [Phaeobacter gallaeciensis]MDE4312066.1 hypothetical protein [Phaeobacter gallaeciensis]MDE4316429.1 hypothetical protein [Phaeobacter gallaeciensis]MDE4321000.1 hypothetical protein [Phaeobacter gallaeciensis]